MAIARSQSWRLKFSAGPFSFSRNGVTTPVMAPQQPRELPCPLGTFLSGIPVAENFSIKHSWCLLRDLWLFLAQELMDVLRKPAGVSGRSLGDWEGWAFCTGCVCVCVRSSNVRVDKVQGLRVKDSSCT